MDPMFIHDVCQGLQATPKYLPSKYLYNARGDRLFQRKMLLPSYYLSEKEYQIFLKHKEDLRVLIRNDVKSFQLIELGVGDGSKTRVLLEHFCQHQEHFSYFPIDISQTALDLLESKLNQLKIPSTHAIQGEYFSALSRIPSFQQGRKVILFFGSTIGNFSNEARLDFLIKLASYLDPGDMCLLGLDLKKNPQTIIDAYTLDLSKELCKNILVRINEEIEGTFVLKNFKHYFSYNPVNGLGESYLLSQLPQTVKLSKIDVSFCFSAWESIHINFHQKFNKDAVSELAEKTGFKVVKNFYDENHYFLESLWLRC